jgi:plasmid maintenance system killer protein
VTLKDKRAERLFHGERIPRFRSIARQAEKRLRILDAADS